LRTSPDLGGPRHTGRRPRTPRGTRRLMHRGPAGGGACSMMRGGGARRVKGRSGTSLADARFVSSLGPSGRPLTRLVGARRGSTTTSGLKGVAVVERRFDHNGRRWAIGCATLERISCRTPAPNRPDPDLEGNYRAHRPTLEREISLFVRPAWGARKARVRGRVRAGKPRVRGRVRAG
jgi:hypothetical protein